MYYTENDYEPIVEPKLSQLEKPGYVFAGWYADSAFTKKVTVEGDGQTILSPQNYGAGTTVTLYAKWMPDLKVEYYYKDTPNNLEKTEFVSYNVSTGTYALDMYMPDARDNSSFAKWYYADGSEAGHGGKREVINAEKADSNNVLKLYGQWMPYIKVHFNTNGGDALASKDSHYTENTYSAVTIDTPIKDKHIFKGWYTDANCTKPIGNVTEFNPYHYNLNEYGYLDENNTQISKPEHYYPVTLYAKWARIATITLVKTKGSGYTCYGNSLGTDYVKSGDTVVEGDKVKITVSFGTTNNRVLRIVNTNTGDEHLRWTDLDTTQTIEFTAPNFDFTIYHTWGNKDDTTGDGSQCVTGDTLIALADGTQKRIDALTGSEQLLVWNHITGKLEAAPVAYIVDHDKRVEEHEVLHLYFADGTNVKIINEHVFFDADLNKYITLDADAENYIGHSFVTSPAADGSLQTAELVKVEKKVMETAVYEVVTYQHLTCFTDGILSASAYMDKLLNIFDVNPDTMAFTAEDVHKDIETYGLYTYADFEDLISEEAFELYNAAYLKIAVGKGYITWDDVLYLIDIFYNVNVQPLQ